MKKTKYFSTIELMRFMAALTIILSHYSRFFLATFSGIKIDPSLPFTWNQMVPFYAHLWRFYVQGLKAVPFFWTLSGFVFGYVYLNKKNFQISAKKYFINRLSRLYPLHILTLLIVISIQLINKNFIGSYQIFPVGDLHRFFSHLFFISSWFNTVYDFNPPIWSVSLEILMYILFFILIKPLYNKKLAIAAPLALTFIAMYKLHIDVSRVINPSIIPCAKFFFTGVVAYLAFERFQKNHVFFLLTLIALIGSAKGTLQLNILFPSILIMAAYADHILSDHFKVIFSSFGNLTYAMYLLHVPIQLCILLFVYKFKLSFSIISSKIFFCTYLTAICFLSHLCFKYFERPLMVYIRKKHYTSISASRASCDATTPP